MGPVRAPRRGATREAFSMAHRNKSTAKNLDAQSGRIEGERLKPIRKVMREIEAPMERSCGSRFPSIRPSSSKTGENPRTEPAARAHAPRSVGQDGSI